MKKQIFVLIISVFLVIGVFSQSANSSGPKDLVVLLDTSSSMSNSYRETSNYLIGSFLQENLRIGDTFHLISFSGTPKLEISRRIEGSGDVETIIARLLLMYPLYPESNISTALSYAESFAVSLPSRSKKVILISDGDAENTQNLVNDSSARFRRLGAELQYIKVPVTGNGSVRAPATSQTTQPAQTAQTTQPAQSGQSTQTAQTGQTAQTTQPATTQTAQTAQSGQSTQPTQTTQSGQTAQTTQPAQTAQSGQSTQATQGGQETQNTQAAQTNETAQQTQSSSPGESAQVASQAATQESSAPSSTQTQAPAQSQAQSAHGPSGTNASPSAGSISAGNIPLPLIIGLGLLLLLLLIGIIIFVSRRLVKSPNRVLAKAATPSPSTPASSAAKTVPLSASQNKATAIPKKVTETRKTDQVLEYPPRKLKPLPKDKVYDESAYGNGGPLLLNLFVEDQNTAIGKRNIHSLKPGYSFTIGGGKSDFLIFLVPIPPRIADVSYDGRNCSFIPRKPQYFPDIGSQTIPNCIGKTFRVISDKKYELHIRLERYEDPLQALNKLLCSIKMPGPVL